MCECFVSMYVPYACLMPAEVGRGHRIPWTLDLRMGCEPLCGIEPGPCKNIQCSLLLSHFSCLLLLAFETAVIERIKEDVEFNCVH